jgi:hypothetical protein
MQVYRSLLCNKFSPWAHCLQPSVVWTRLSPTPALPMSFPELSLSSNVGGFACLVAAVLRVENAVVTCCLVVAWLLPIRSACIVQWCCVMWCVLATCQTHLCLACVFLSCYLLSCYINLTICIVRCAWRLSCLVWCFFVVTACRARTQAYLQLFWMS